MPRSYSGGFSGQKSRPQNSEPFLTAVFRFSENDAERTDVAVIGRSIEILGGLNPTINSVLHYSLVTNWGTMGSTFGRQPDGTVDIQEVNLVLCNFPDLPYGTRLSDLFLSDFETVPIDFYWNYLVRSGPTVYSEIETSGAAHSPSSYNFRDVKLRVTSLMDKYLFANMLRAITNTSHPTAPTSSLNKVFPIAIGDTTEAGVDGARIPSICVNLEKSNFVACENPPEMPVTEVGGIYWVGHKVVEGDFSIGSSTDLGHPSETVPLNMAGPPGGDGRGEIPDVFDVGFLGPIDNPVQLGATSSRLSHIVQPFIAKHEVQIVNASFGATRWDAGDPSIPIRPIGLGFMDSDDAVNDGGLLVSPSTAVADITMFRARGTSNDVQPATDAGDAHPPSADSSVNFDLHGWSPAVGKQHYALAYIEGSSAGIPADPDNQWYNVGLENSVSSLPIYSGIELNAPAYAVDWDGNVTPLGKYLPLQLNGPTSGRWNAVTSEATDSVGATGLYSVALAPVSATVIGAISLGLRKRASVGAPDGSGVTLKGSTTASIVEVDENGVELNSIASASFSAAEFDPKLTPGAYSREMKRLSTPALLEAGKHYVGKLDGTVDATGQYSGWVVRGFTNPEPSAQAPLIFGGGSSTGIVGARGWSLMPPNIPMPPNGPIVTKEAMATPFDEPVGMDVTFHSVKFERSLTTDEAGNPVAMIHAYITDPVNDLNVVPDGTAISTDIACPTTQPDEVFHALLNRGAVPDERIDLAGTFAASATKYSDNSYKMRGAIIEQQSYKTWAIRAAFEMRSNFDWEADKAQLKWIPSPGDMLTPVRTLTLDDIVSDGEYPKIEIQRTEETDIINVIDVLFQRMFDHSPSDFRTNPKGASAHLLGETFYSVPSVKKHREQRKPELFWMNYIRDVAVAESVGLFSILWLAFIKQKPIITSKMHILELMKDDVIGISLAPTAASIAAEADSILGDDDIGPLGEDSGHLGSVATFGGYDATLALVLGVNRLPPQFRVELTTIEI